MSAEIGTTNISFSGLRTAYNNGGAFVADGDETLANETDESDNPNIMSLGLFRNATFTDGTSVPSSGEISINSVFREKTFGSSGTTLTIRVTDFSSEESLSGVSFFVDSNSETSVPFSSEGYNFSGSQTTTTNNPTITLIHADFESAPLVTATYFDSSEEDYLEIENGIGEFSMTEDPTPSSSGQISSSNLESHTNIFLIVEFSGGEGGDDY